MELTLHAFWTGPPAPEWVGENLNRWQELHPTWNIAVVGTLPDEPLEIYELTKERVVPFEQPRHAANIYRIWALREAGGVWADCDITPLRSFESLDLDHPWVPTLADVETCVMGGPKGHPAFVEMLDAIRRTPYVGSSSIVSGTTLLTPIASRHGFIHYPPWMFFDRDARGMEIELPEGEERYATHAWATSSW